MGKKSRVAQRRVVVIDDKYRKHRFNPGDEVPEELMKFIKSDRVFTARAGEDISSALEGGNMRPQDSEPKELKDLDYKTLLKMAADKGVEFQGNPKKQDVIDALLFEASETDETEEDEEEFGEEV